MEALLDLALSNGFRVGFLAAALFVLVRLLIHPAMK